MRKRGRDRRGEKGTKRGRKRKRERGTVRRREICGWLEKWLNTFDLTDSKF